MQSALDSIDAAFGRKTHYRTEVREGVPQDNAASAELRRTVTGPCKVSFSERLAGLIEEIGAGQYDLVET